VVVPVPDESGASAALALELAATEFASLGVRIERVLTDNALAYCHARAYARVIGDLGARHKHTRPFRPQTNGKASASIKTLLHEWAYGRAHTTNQERLTALSGFVASTIADVRTLPWADDSPWDAVNNVHGTTSSP